MTKWEYRIQTECGSLSEHPLNTLGNDRWELVSVTADNLVRDMQPNQTAFICVFKREKQERTPTAMYTAGNPPRER